MNQTIEVEPQPWIDTLVRLAVGGEARRTEYVGTVWFDGKPEVSGLLRRSPGIGYRIVALTPPDAAR
jgi:hypothetical protein